MLQGVARSLLAARAADSVHQSAELAMSCDPSGPRRFAPYAELALGALRSGQTPPGELPRLAAGMLLSSEALLASTSSDRHEREPYGPADNTAAGWVAPVAVAYAGAGAGALEAAVQEACRATHTHPLGVDGARVVAAAVAWCMQQPAPGPADGAVSGPEAQPQQARQLLQHLLGVARTGDMQAKLELMLDSLEQVGWGAAGFVWGLAGELSGVWAMVWLGCGCVGWVGILLQAQLAHGAVGPWTGVACGSFLTVPARPCFLSSPLRCPCVPPAAGGR